MRAEGVTPNLVTFNTLIDVYGKTGQWEEAVRVLDTLEQQVRPMMSATQNGCQPFRRADGRFSGIADVVVDVNSAART